jgi:NAD(P)H-flavin reductase
MHHEFWASIANREQIATGTFQVTFTHQENDFKFSPGQYIWVVLPSLVQSDPKGNRRAFLSPLQLQKKIQFLFSSVARNQVLKKQ